MPTPMRIAFGSNYFVDHKITDIRVRYLPEAATVELVASISPDPNRLDPEHVQATSVAIHMDQSVATTLFGQLRETFRSMGWPLPK